MLIDGRALAQKLYQKLNEDLGVFLKKTKMPPRLDVILVGNDAASRVYVTSKQKTCRQYGIDNRLHQLEASASEDEVISLIEHLNGLNHVHGILLQLPLPKGLDPLKIISHIDPLKDVDGLHPDNMGLLLHGKPRLVPCTPQGCLQLIQSCRPNLSGARALIIGRSILVGKPLALLLTLHDATVTLAHSKTEDLPRHCQQADILVAAVGVPNFIRGEWINPQAIVIDVGINKDAAGHICGDVDFKNAVEHVAAITPVPGGVGPMTIANLLVNTLKAAQLQI